MTNSPPSSSDGDDRSTAFGRLHPAIQRWIWQREWNELRDIQESAAHAILGTSSDVLIAAATASGKTEAAFFPLLTTIAQQPDEPGIRAVYVSPLRTLINDQHMRLEDICRELPLPVHRWHGDVGASAKQAVLKRPRGIVLITPESLEALFVLRGPALKGLFSRVAAVVVDEVHSFIGQERGRQLQSLLHRLELIGRERIRRVGLSATLGDMGLAAEFLRPGAGSEVKQIISAVQGPGLKLQIRGYEGGVAPESEGDEAHETANESIVAHLFQTLYGTENLVFCNRRQDVETYADRLRERGEGQKRPNLFFPHHGSLSRELREDVERLLKDDDRPITVVCTSTLELGVDIGSVRSVAQVGPPPSVASLRQRLGRSGRRDEPAVLRLYVSERHIGPDPAPQDQLRAGLVQSIAMVELLLERWCEPPETGALHLSTLIQQTLSVIAQHGGATAQQLFRLLCDVGAFREVQPSMFHDLLRALGQQGVLMQSENGALFLAPAGERIVEHYTFYSAFTSPEEYRVVSGGKELGTLPLTWALGPGMFLIFAGRRWMVEVVDERAKVIEVRPAEGGKPPEFGGSGGTVHARVRERMRQIYERTDEPIFLDGGAKALLSEARANFSRLGLRDHFAIQAGRNVVVFPWAGDRAQQTLSLMLVSRGLSVEPAGLGITVVAGVLDTVADHIRDLAELPPPDPLDLARRSPTRIIEKHDRLLSDALLAANFASRYLDVEDAHKVAKRIAAVEP